MLRQRRSTCPHTKPLHHRMPSLSSRPPCPPGPASFQIIGEHMGGRTSALLRFLLAATKLLHRDGYAAMTSRLRGLRADLGRGFAAQLAVGEGEASLTITRCLYHDIFAAQGQPQLAACCCCTQDQVGGWVGLCRWRAGGRGPCVRSARARMTHVRLPGAHGPCCCLAKPRLACVEGLGTPIPSAESAGMPAPLLCTPTAARCVLPPAPPVRSGLSPGTAGWRPAAPLQSAPATPAAASACAGCRHGDATPGALSQSSGSLHLWLRQRACEP